MSDEENPSEGELQALSELTDRLRDNYPFGSPSYAGQMLKPPHPVAWAAYAATTLINPNNHALDGGPATAQMEREVIAEIATMFGFEPSAVLGHLTSGGTMANLEALWIARELHPERPIAYGANAHYTHSRVCGVLGARGIEVPCDGDGRMDLDALERRLRHDRPGTVVASFGTTGVGALDPVREIADLCVRYDARLHVDAAYGGFFALIGEREPALIDVSATKALRRADSVVVDPHKHGLQPYGCGCVIFADPTVGRFYKHDSPYTYFSSAELHPGEVTLECSRSGSAAAALWTTMRAIPLTPNGGLGDMLAAGRQAALVFADAIADAPNLRLVYEAQTDIVVFAPYEEGLDAAATSEWTKRVFRTLMTDAQSPLFLATIRVDSAACEWLREGGKEVTVLRSVLMKPEHRARAAGFVETISRAAGAQRTPPAGHEPGASP